MDPPIAQRDAVFADGKWDFSQSPEDSNPTGCYRTKVSKALLNQIECRYDGAVCSVLPKGAGAKGGTSSLLTNTALGC